MFICNFDLQSGEQKAYLVYGYCISLDNTSEVTSRVIVVSCPFTAGKQAVSPGTLLPKWPEELHEYCEHFNRSGRRKSVVIVAMVLMLYQSLLTVFLALTLLLTGSSISQSSYSH